MSKSITGTVVKGATHVGARTVKHGASHLMPYAAPWMWWLVLPMFGTVTHQFAAASMAAAVAVGSLLTAGAVYLTGHTWQVFTPRGESVRNQATGTVGVACLWLLWVTAVGLWRTPVWHRWHVLSWLASMWNGWPWGAWLLGGGILAIAWNVRRSARGDGHTEATSDDGLLDKLKVAGRLGKAKVDEVGRVRQAVRVAPGEHTIADLQTADAQAMIASFGQIRRGGVRVTENPDNPVEGEIVFTPVDPIAGVRPWPGPTAPDASIADAPVSAGLDEDGDPRLLWLPGGIAQNPNMAHLGVGGMSGAGKTETGLVFMADALRSDVVVIASDHVKAGQTIGALGQAYGLYADDRPSAAAMFKQLPAVITARTQRLGQHGFKQWTAAAAAPPCNLKFVIYWVEEAAALLANSAMFVQVTESARSAGIMLFISQQRWTYDRIPTSARENMGAGWCFGIKDRENADYVLDEQTIDNGAKPWLWKSGDPGKSYLEHPSVPTAKWPVPLRGWFEDDPQRLREVAADQVAHHGVNQLDATTAAAFGDVYRTYMGKVNEGAAGWQTAAGRTATVIPIGGRGMTNGQVRADDDDVDLIVDGEDSDDAEFDDAVAAAQFDDGDAEVELPGDPDGDLPDDLGALDGPDDDVPSLEFDVPQPVRQLSRSEALAAVRDFCRRAALAGQDTVAPADLVEVRAQVGRSPAWLTGALRTLTAEGVLTPLPDRGLYGLARPRHGHAA